MQRMWKDLSESTAAGLRVTTATAPEVLVYLTAKVGFKYLMTSKNSQDPLENFSGIVRHAAGNNDHPTPTSF